MSKKTKTKPNTNGEVYIARAVLGVTQAQLGDLLGVHWTSVSRWECDRATMPVPTLRLLRTLVRLHQGGDIIVDVDEAVDLLERPVSVSLATG